MFGISGFELFLILLFGFLIFGPDKLPAMAKSIGGAIRKFRNAQEEMGDVLKNEVFDPNAEEPFKDPLAALDKMDAAIKKSEPTESFSQRKARYDRERAAQKAAEPAEEKPAKAAGTPASTTSDHKATPAEIYGAVAVTPMAKKAPAKEAPEADGAVESEEVR
ncbi:MAG: twin-arginine translocase TatA/TatE family subunit [Eggerthellaceae bacterium]|nr:twin-arginine translocase TatA/TatE family subunit [Eggerthellaceae bacterium]